MNTALNNTNYTPVVDNNKQHEIQYSNMDIEVGTAFIGITALALLMLGTFVIKLIPIGKIDIEKLRKLKRR